MKTQDRASFIFNYFFLFGIVALFLNDQIFKWEFHNWFTGKLSDIVGVFILPFLLSYFFPKHIKKTIIFTGLFFIFWKSPFSEGFIQLYNQLTFIPIGRVVDITDLIALATLPLSYYILKHIQNFRLNLRMHPLLVVLPSCLAIMATSKPLDYEYSSSNGNLDIRTDLKVDHSSYFILSKLEEKNVKVVIDSTLISELFIIDKSQIDTTGTDNHNYFKIESFVISGDTITDFQFYINELSGNTSKIYLNGIMTNYNIEDEDEMLKQRKKYRKLLKKYFSELLD